MDTNHRNVKLKGTLRYYWMRPSVLGDSKCSKTIPDSYLPKLCSNSQIVCGLCPSRRVYCSFSWKAFCSIRLCLVYCNVDRFLFFFFLQGLKKQFSPCLEFFSNLLPIEKLRYTSCFIFFSGVNKLIFSVFSNGFPGHHAFLKHFFCCSHLTYSFLKIWWSKLLLESILVPLS